MDSREPEFSQARRATEEVARQPLIALLRRIKLPPGTSIEDGGAFLEDAEAAEFLRIGRRTLQRLRQHGAGPPVVRIGRRRLVYRFADLQQWAQDQSSPATGKGSLGGRRSTEPTEQAGGHSEALPAEVCGRCRAFGAGRCHARDIAVGAEEPCCPLFVRVA